MNFFEHQDQARQQTNQLVFLFIAGMVGVIVSAYLLLLFVFTISSAVDYSSSSTAPQLWEPELFFQVAVSISVVIGLGSLYKLHQLSQGGSVVAIALGGRLLNPENNQLEFRLQNIVTEVAIASGVPIPEIYVLEDERGINAFAAGLSIESAVIGVTQGCLETFDRDELQGVIAHEFSHILNGDMRLNVRLMGALHGLFSVYIVGRVLARSRYYRAFADEDGRSTLRLLGVIGSVVMGCGSIGLLFGRIIQSAISRQREFLADASAVQFTRNNEGIASALYKIQRSFDCSFVNSPAAESSRHMFFGNAIRQSLHWTNLFDTHPPISERIKRLGVLPGVLEQRYQSPRNQSRRNSKSAQPSSGWSSAASEAAPMQGFAATPGNAVPPRPTQPKTQSRSSSGSGTRPRRPPSSPSPEAVVAGIGTIGQQQLSFAQSLLQDIPVGLRYALMTPDGSIGLLFALVIQELDAPTVQSQRVAKLITDAQFKSFQSCLGELKDCDPQLFLPLVDLSVAELRSQTKAQRVALLKNIQQFRSPQDATHIRSAALQIILHHRLQAQMKSPSTLQSTTEFKTTAQVWAEAITVLSALAIAGQERESDQLYTLRDGLSRLGKSGRSLPDALEPINWQKLEISLQRLAQATPKLKQALVNTCTYTALLDGIVTQAETDLLRAIVIAMGCPMPPILTRMKKKRRQK